MSNSLVIALGFLMPALLVLRAFMLSRKAKGWYALGIAGLLYTFGALWLITATLALGLKGAELANRVDLTVTGGLPLFFALLLCAEAMYWLPGAGKTLWARWKARKKVKPARKGR